MTELYTCRSLCRNFPSDSKDELIRDLLKALNEGSDTHTPIPATSHAFILTPAPTPLSNNGLFQQFMKTYLEN